MLSGVELNYRAYREPLLTVREGSMLLWYELVAIILCIIILILLWFIVSRVHHKKDKKDE